MMEDELDALLADAERYLCGDGRLGSATSATHSDPGNDSPRQAFRRAESLASNQSGKRSTPEPEERPARGARPAASARSTASGESLDLDDLDGILNELDLSPMPARSARVSRPESRAAVTTTNKSQRTSAACFAVYLAGTDTPMGRCSIDQTRACDCLRCTDCDFSVCFFDGFRWDDDCDYLFLRNNVPNAEKLRARLSQAAGVRAYACQCKWQSVSALTKLTYGKGLKWVCSKKH